MRTSSFSSRSRRELWLACAVYSGFLCLAYGNVVFRGKSLVYSDNYNPVDPRLNSRSYGKYFVPDAAWGLKHLVQTANFHDAGATLWQGEPAGEFLRKAIQDGEMPFWDPYVGGGVPSMSNLTPAYFFPPSLLLVTLGDFSLLKNIYFLGIAFSSALLTFLILRKHGAQFLGSLVGGAAFMFCGAISQNIGSFIGQTAACIPLALFATAWFFDHPTRRRAAGLAAVYAGVSLASFPPVLAQVFGLSAIYALWRIFSSEEGFRLIDRRRCALLWISATVLGAGLVAWYYFPAFALFREVPQVGHIYSDAARASFPLICFFQLLSPTLFGGMKVLAHSPMPEPFFLELPYVGVVPLVLALLACPKGGRRRALCWFSWTAAILVALKLFGVPPIQWIADVPGLKTIHFAAYFGIALDFLIALLAGLGLDSLFRGETSGQRAWLSVGALVVAVLSLRSNAIEKGVLQRVGGTGWQRHCLLLLALSLGVSGLIVAGQAFRGVRKVAVWVGVGIVLVAGLEGARNSYYPRQYRWDVWRHPVPYVEKLISKAGFLRCFVIGTLPANTNSPFGIFSLDSLMTFNPPREKELYQRFAGASDQSVFLREATTIPPDAVLDKASIGYIVVRRDDSWAVREASARDYAIVFDDGFTKIFQRPTLPRYFFTSDYRIRRGPSSIEDLFDDAPMRQVVAEAPLSFSRQPNTASDPDVTILEFRRNRLALSLSAPRPGLLACSENDFPGWSASVNGRPAKILPVNYAFRGVEIPAGRVEVRFRYWPPGLTAGGAVSALGLLALAVLGKSERVGAGVTKP